MWGSSYPYGIDRLRRDGHFSATATLPSLPAPSPAAGTSRSAGCARGRLRRRHRRPAHRPHNEGFDLLYGGASQGTTSEQATAYAPSPPSRAAPQVPDSSPSPPAPARRKATSSSTGETFENAWNYSGTSQIGVDERDVTSFSCLARTPRRSGAAATTWRPQRPSWS
jgi:hypothetical protein